MNFSKALWSGLLFTILSLVIIPGQALTLKIATLAPAGTTWMKEMKKGAKEIRKQTQGRVKFKFYPGGVMGNDQSVHRKIRINQLQGGAFSSSGLSTTDTAIQLYSLPMLFSNYDQVDKVRNTMDSEIIASVKNNGFQILGITEGGFARVLSATPINTMEDIRANKVWIPEGDTLVETTFEVMGIKPVSLPLADVYTGLQTGLIDTISSTSTGAIAFQWHTKLKYAVDIPVLYVIGVLAVSNKAFNKIKPEDQKIVMNIMQDTFARLGKINRKDNINATAALKSQGITFTQLQETEVSRWQQFAKESINRLVQEKKIRAELVQSVREIISP